VVIKTLVYKKMHLNVMLVLADGGKLPPHVILNCKTMPEGQLPRRITVTYQTQKTGRPVNLSRIGC
jgi:hypothetical protein